MAKYKAAAIISSYASERFTQGCLEDLIDQTIFKKNLLQIIVIDSCSPESEYKIVQEFQKHYPQIVYFRSEQRESLYAAWNRGLEIADAEFITNANSDDRHRFDAIEILCQALEDNHSIDLVYANSLRTEIANERFSDHRGNQLYKFSKYFAPDVMLHYQFGPQPLWRKSLHSKLGLFNPEFKAAGDWEFNYRFNLSGAKALHLDQTLGLFFDHPQSISRANNKSEEEQAQLRLKYLKSANIFKLYELENWPVSTPQEKVKALTHFGLKSLKFSLPWEPGQSFNDLGIALECFTTSAQILPESSEVISNLASVLAFCGRSQDAVKLLKSCPRNIELQSENLKNISEGKLEKIKLYGEERI